MNAAQQARIARLELLARAHPDSRVVLHLAEAHRRAGQLEQALHVLEERLARQPDDAAARVLLGRVLLDLGRWAEAQQAFRAALAGQPEHMEIVALRALGELAALWRSDAALGKAARAERAATSPQRPGAAQPMPPAAARGAAAAARADTRTAIPLHDLPWEEIMMVTETLAELYAAQGLTGQAIALYRELLASRPGDARIRERLRALTREHESGPELGITPAAEATTSSSEPAGERPADLARAAAAEGLEISFVRMAQPAEEAVDAAPPAPPAPPDAEPAPEAAAAPVDASRPEPAPPHAPAVDDLDWLFTPAAAPPVVASADAWAHLTALADLALDALDERRAGNTAAARHVRRLARATAHELGMDGSAAAVLELAAQLLGIAVPAGASAGAWIAAAAARLDPLDLPAEALEVLRHAAWLDDASHDDAAHDDAAHDDAAHDDAAHDTTLAARVLAAAVAFRAELARRGPTRLRALREAGAVLWHDAGQRYGREVIAALLGAVARDPTLAFPVERRVLVLGADDVEAAAIAQPFRAAGDRVERARSLDRARTMLGDAGDHAAVVLLPDVGADGATHLARELAAMMQRARPVVVATGIGDAASRTALLAAGADLCFGPGITAAEVHAATAALLRRLGEAGGDDGAAAAAASEPAGRTGVRGVDHEGIA